MGEVKIILLNGKAGAGKDHYYLNYKEKFDNSEYIVRFAFADAIKDIMCKFFKWDGKDKEGAWRTAAQTIGNSFRSINKTVWVDYLEETIAGYIDFHSGLGDKGVTVIITDTRFTNEIIRIKELFPNCKVIVKRLHREFDSNLTKEQMDDISEQGIPDYMVDEEIYLGNYKDDGE